MFATHSTAVATAARPPVPSTERIPTLPSIARGRNTVDETPRRSKAALIRDAGKNAMPSVAGDEPVHHALTARSAPHTSALVPLPPPPRNEASGAALTTRLAKALGRSTRELGPLDTFPVSHFPTTSKRVGRGTTVVPTTGNKPPLAVELEAFVRREVNLITRHGGGAAASDPFAKVPIAREALGCFVNHFPEYAEPLQLIQALYDAAVELGFEQRLRLHNAESTASGFEDLHRSAMERERDVARQQTDAVRAQLSRMEGLCDQLTRRHRELEIELKRTTATLSERNQSLDEADARATLFERAVVDLTDKGAAILQRLTTVRRDNERLTHNNAVLERQMHEAEEKVVLYRTTVASAGQQQQQRNPTSSATQLQQDGVGGGRSGVEGAQSSAVLTTPMATTRGLPIRDDPHEVVLDLEERLKNAQRQNAHLLSLHRGLQDRVRGLEANMERERADMTPRPRWSAVKDALPAVELNPLGTSEEKLDDVLQAIKDELAADKRDVEKAALSDTVRQWLAEEDLCESDLVVGRHRFIPCKGTGKHVPLFLRARGVVRNRRLRKGDVEQLLARFWRDRRAHMRSESHLNVMPLDAFYLSWLTRLTSTTTAGIELAYNMMLVCERHQSDPDCAMFIRILRGELCEQAIYDQLDMLEGLLDTLEANDRMRRGVLSRFTIHRILTKLFPTKSRQDMLRVRFALLMSGGGNAMIQYRSLFLEDAEGNQSRFIETLRRQHVQESAVFAVEIEEALREAIRSDDGKLTVALARSALRHLDPGMPMTCIDDAIAYGCMQPLADLESQGSYFAFEAEPFLARLRQGVLLRRYARPVRHHHQQHGELESDSDDMDAGDARRLDDMEPINDDSEQLMLRAEVAEAAGEGNDILLPEGNFTKALLLSAVGIGTQVTVVPADMAASTSRRHGSPPGGGGLATRPSEFQFLDKFRQRSRPSSRTGAAGKGEDLAYSTIKQSFNQLKLPSSAVATGTRQE